MALTCESVCLRYTLHHCMPALFSWDARREGLEIFKNGKLTSFSISIRWLVGVAVCEFPPMTSTKHSVCSDVAVTFVCTVPRIAEMCVCTSHCCLAEMCVCTSLRMYVCTSLLVCVCTSHCLFLSHCRDVQYEKPDNNNHELRSLWRVELSQMK